MRVDREKFENWVEANQHESGVRMVNVVKPGSYKETYMNTYDDTVLAELVDDAEGERYFLY